MSNDEEIKQEIQLEEKTSSKHELITEDKVCKNVDEFAGESKTAQSSSTGLLKTSKQVLIVEFVIFTFGVVATLSGYYVFLNLQSSINIKGGVGAASLTATYVTAAIFGVIVTPVILRGLGAKKCAILSEMAYLSYIVLNAYPEYVALIPAGIIAGVGEATLWPVMTLFCVHYACCFAHYATKDPQIYATELIGVLYFLYHLSATFGNLLKYAILYGGRQEMQHPNATLVRNLSICGRNDCQDPDVTKANIERYEPASQMLIHILIGITGGPIFFSILIHAIFIKDMDPAEKIRNAKQRFKENDVNLDVIDEVTVAEGSTKKQPSIQPSISSTVQATFHHLFKPKQLLITPFALYSGTVIYFAIGEVTRAFGSCILGVDQVGLLAALTGVADGIMSYLSCKITGRAGRNVTVAIGFCIDITFYIVCLSWNPTKNTLGVVYFVFICIGISDGIWQPLVNDLHGAYFPEELDIAFTVWNMYLIVGIAWQAGWSTSLCVSTKIYFQIALLCVTVTCYVVSQCVYYRKRSNVVIDLPKLPGTS